MPYLTKKLTNGHEVGITNGEIILPVRSLLGLDDETVARLVRELALDYEFLKEHLGSGKLDYMTIDQAKEFLAQEQRQKKTRTIKQELTKKRRIEFSSKRAQLMLSLIQRDGYKCQSPGCQSQDDLTIDHVLALSKGGSDELLNLRLMSYP